MSTTRNWVRIKITTDRQETDGRHIETLELIMEEDEVALLQEDLRRFAAGDPGQGYNTYAFAEDSQDGPNPGIRLLIFEGVSVEVLGPVEVFETSHDYETSLAAARIARNRAPMPTAHGSPPETAQ